MAKVECNFAAARLQVDSLLSQMQQEADQAALSAIADAEWTLSEAKQAIALLPDPYRAEFRESQAGANHSLSAAKSAQASRDYRALLNATPEAARGKALSSAMRKQAAERNAELQRARDARVKEAWRAIPDNVGVAFTIAFLCWLVVGTGGCLVRFLNPPWTFQHLRAAYSAEGGVIAFLLGLLGGALFGVWQFHRTVEGK
jgi:hypothetical protein